MSSLQQKFLLLTGIGASFVLACGSLYLLYMIKDSDQVKIERKKKLKVDNDGHNPTLQDCERITVYMEVPAIVWEQSNRFQAIQVNTDTLIDAKSVQFSPDNSNSITTEDTYKEIHTLGDFYKYISIEGYREDVVQASKLIEQYIVSCSVTVPHVQIFEVRTSQVACIIGRNGTTVSAIEKQSGANVAVERNSSNMFSTVKLYGTLEQIKEAYRIIDEHLTRDRRYQNRYIKYVDEDTDSESDAYDLYQDTSKSANEQQPIEPTTANNEPLVPSAPHTPHYTNHKLTLAQLNNLTEKLDLNEMCHLIPPQKVFVSYIDSPKSFYVQINDSRSTNLDKMQQEMDVFYSVDDNRQSCLCDADAIYVGDMVAIVLDETSRDEFNCFRGYVCNIVPALEQGQEKMFEIFYVDLGQCEVHPLYELFHLTDTFLHYLPFQAIHCSLTGLENTGLEWCQHTKVIELFRELTREGLWENVTSLRCVGKLETSETCTEQNHINNILPTFLVELFRELPDQTVNVGYELSQIETCVTSEQVENVQKESVLN